jgi:hypothetical protein
MIGLSRDDFAGVLHLMSVGRWAHGLIHNLNGPLQNLGMDMDMIEYSLGQEGIPPQELMEEIQTRLRRMEEEFDRINRQIRATASRVAPDAEDEYLSLGEFLEEEILFLKASPYLKHHVDTTLSLDEELPEMKDLPAGFAGALRGLLAAVVEEVERGEMEALTIEASSSESRLGVAITLGGGTCSRGFLEMMRPEGPEEGLRKVAPGQMAAAGAALLLARAGARVDLEAGENETRISLAL